MHATEDKEEIHGILNNAMQVPMTYDDHSSLLSCIEHTLLGQSTSSYRNRT